MTVERVYRCNLCHMARDPDDELTGIYWTGDGQCTIEFSAARNVEHHICQHCLDDITRLVTNTKPEQEAL